MESVRDNVVTIAKSANATGKTHGAARVAIWFYMTYPDAQVYTTAAPPERNLRKLLWGEIWNLVNKQPQLFSGDKTGASLNIERGPQSFITGVTIPMQGTSEQREAKFSGKHAPHILFIVDEADAVPSEVFKGIESCMSGGHARLLVMFNPRGEYGPVAKMEKEHLGHLVTLSAFSHPNVLTGTDVIPGAVTQTTTVRRINQWSRALMSDERPDVECYEVPEFLVGLTAAGLDGVAFPPLAPGWRKITNPSFSYMVLGQYPSQSESQLISRAWVDAAISRWYSYVALRGERPPTDHALVGLDVAEYGKDWNVLCRRHGGWVAPLDRWNGMDTEATALRAKNTLDFTTIDPDVFVDGNGIGAGVAPRLAGLGVRAVGIKVQSSPTFASPEGEFMMLRDQLWWEVREWLRKDPGAMLPPDDELVEDLCTPSYAMIRGKIKISDKDTLREMLGRSTDKADALCLTFASSGGNTTAEGDYPFEDYRG